MLWTSKITIFLLPSVIWWSVFLKILIVSYSFQQHYKKSISLDNLLSILLLFCRRVISFLVLEPPGWEMVGSGPRCVWRAGPRRPGPREPFGSPLSWSQEEQCAQYPLVQREHLCASRVSKYLYEDASWNKRGAFNYENFLVVLWRSTRWPFTEEMTFQLLKTFCISKWPSVLFRVIALISALRCRYSSPNHWSSAPVWLWAVGVPRHPSRAEPSAALLDAEKGGNEKVAVQKATLGRKINEIKD